MRRPPRLGGYGRSVVRARETSMRCSYGFDAPGSTMSRAARGRQSFAGRSGKLIGPALRSLATRPATMAGSARLPRWASNSGLPAVAARTELPAMQMPAMAGSVMGSRSSSQARNAANMGERCSPRRGSIGCRAGGGPAGAAGTAVWISGMMGPPRSGGKESAPPRDRTGRGAAGTGALRRGMRRSRQYGRRQRRSRVRIRRYGRHALPPRRRWKAGRPGR